jgi:hypothetical protein
MSLLVALDAQKTHVFDKLSGSDTPSKTPQPRNPTLASSVAFSASVTAVHVMKDKSNVVATALGAATAK